MVASLIRDVPAGRESITRIVAEAESSLPAASPACCADLFC